MVIRILADVRHYAVQICHHRLAALEDNEVHGEPESEEERTTAEEGPSLDDMQPLGDGDVSTVDGIVHQIQPWEVADRWVNVTPPPADDIAPAHEAPAAQTPLPVAQAAVPVAQAALPAAQAPAPVALAAQAPVPAVPAAQAPVPAAPAAQAPAPAAQAPVPTRADADAYLEAAASSLIMTMTCLDIRATGMS